MGISMRDLLLMASVCTFVWLTVDACKCQTLTSQQAFCNAHWVSHVKVKVRISKQPMPKNSTRKGLNNLRYAIEHVKTFKTPLQFEGKTLPKEVFTPSESPACGLLIEAGREYLLAGRVDGESLTTVLCGQVLPDNREASSYENVLEWRNVPETLIAQLDNNAFAHC